MTNTQRKRVYKKKFKVANDHNSFLERIRKSLYYGKLPNIPCLSLPVTELCSELFSETHKGKSLKRLHVEDAAELSRNACVSPCSLVLALLYLERLKNTNPEYVSKIAPTELFLVSLMVSNKFLQDDGEEDEVFCGEWAMSGGVTLQTLHQLEKEFLGAIDWRIYVGEQNFEEGLNWLEQNVAIRQAKLRGWFTYADLVSTVTTLEHVNLLKCLLIVYLALSLSYLASVLTLVASSCIVSQGTSLINNYNSLPNLIQSKELYNATSDYRIREMTPPNHEIILPENVSYVVTTNELFYSSKLANFRLNPDYFRSLVLTISNTMMYLQKNIIRMEFMTILTPNFITQYGSQSDLTNNDSPLTLNDVYLNIKQPSTSWCREYSPSFSWQYSDSIRY